MNVQGCCYTKLYKLTTLSLGLVIRTERVAPAIRSGGGRRLEARPPSAVFQGDAVAGSRRVPADPSEPRIGDVLLLADADYKFGTGPLVIEVQAIRSRGTLPDGTWWRIEVYAGMRARPRGVAHR